MRRISRLGRSQLDHQMAQKQNFARTAGRRAVAGHEVGRERCCLDWNCQMAKSARAFPPSSAVASHFGFRPRPDQVTPDAGSRYLAATFLPLDVPTFDLCGATTPAAVRPCSAMNCRTRTIAAVYASAGPTQATCRRRFFLAADSKRRACLTALWGRGQTMRRWP